MKKIIICLLAFILCLSIVSCGGNEGKKDNGDDSGNESVELSAVGKATDYKLVRADNSSDEGKAAAMTLRKAIAAILGNSPKLGTDYDSEKAKEILIGATKRSQSQAALEGLGYYDYVIKQDGDKIVIVGGSDESLATAVDYFIENCLGDDLTLSVPTGDGYRYTHKIMIENLSIDGVDIKEFKIYNLSVLDSEQFNEFSSKLKVDIAGAEISSVDTSLYSIDDGGHYIVLDGTNLVPSEYSITVEGGNLILRGSHDTLPLAIEEFVGNYLGSFDKKEYNITSADNKSYETEKKTIPYTKDQLMTLLSEVYESDQVIIGEQYSGKTPDSINNCIENFHEATGEYQSILGIDLACYGIDLMELNDAYWSAFICDIVDYCSEGGILTASAHWENPSGNLNGGDRCRGLLGYDDTKEGYERAFEELLTEGTDYNTFWKKELAEEARFLKALGDAGVSVIWRPLHETNGNWFWFCTTQNGNTLDASYLVRMWIYVHDYFTKELGLTNLLWCYGPNYSNNIEETPGKTMSPWYLYPGDEYVDMVGLDWYTEGEYEILNNDSYTTLVEKTGKIGAITEFGPSGSLLKVNAPSGTEQSDLFSADDMYGLIYELQRDYECKFAYFLTWAGQWNIVNMGLGDKLMSTDLALTRAEVLEMFKAMN